MTAIDNILFQNADVLLINNNKTLILSLCSVALGEQELLLTLTLKEEGYHFVTNSIQFLECLN